MYFAVVLMFVVEILVDGTREWERVYVRTVYLGVPRKRNVFLAPSACSRRLDIGWLVAKVVGGVVCVSYRITRAHEIQELGTLLSECMPMPTPCVGL